MKRFLFFLAIILTIVLDGCKINEEKEESPETLKIKTIQARLINYNYTVTSVGRIVSDEELKLGFKTGGVIRTIKTKEGDFVKKGQVMAELNLAEINASVKQAELAYNKASRDFLRTKNLYKDSVATLEQYENARTALEYARANVEIADFNLKHSTITAPFNGIVLKQLARENELIAPGYPVFLFGSENKNWLLKVNVADKDVVLIEKGNEALVNIDAFPDSVFKAEVTEIDKFSDPYTGTYEIDLQVNPEGKIFMSGLIANTTIFTNKQEQYIQLPYNSVMAANQDEGYIYSIVNGRIEKVNIRIAQMTDDGILIYPDNVNHGDSVVTEGANYIQSGIAFEIIN